MCVWGGIHLINIKSSSMNTTNEKIPTRLQMSTIFSFGEGRKLESRTTPLLPVGWFTILTWIFYRFHTGHDPNMVMLGVVERDFSGGEIGRLSRPKRPYRTDRINHLQNVLSKKYYCARRCWLWWVFFFSLLRHH